MREKTVLVVDDDPDILSVLRTGLSAEGWTVIEATNRDDLLRAVDRNLVDVVALDLTLQGEDGLELAQTLRQQFHIPILMIVEHDDSFDRHTGLESGADDYVFKPLHVSEVALRLDRILDRYHHEITADMTVTFDHSSFDLRRRIVQRLDGGEVPLTALELTLLDLFVRHPGRVLSRDEISRALHGREWTPYDRTIDTHVARLRRKIEPAADEGPSLIRSVRGVGYVFTGDVTPVTDAG